MSHVLIYSNPNISNVLFNKIVSENISNVQRTTIIDNLVIKCVYIKYEYVYEISKKENTEFYLIKEYITQQFKHQYFLDYYSIILFDCNLINSPDLITKLTYYKDVVSPMLNTDNKNVNTIGYIMPKYEPLQKYLNNNNNLSPILLINNILGILDLSILIRDKYELIHSDVKICNIVVNNDTFYLIDWECAFFTDEVYYSSDRPKTGNTEMYPFYDVTAEQFFIHSIGVLIVRILGYRYEVTYKDFIKHLNIKYILTKIPYDIIKPFEYLIIDIFDRKLTKIEELIDNIKSILDNIVSNNG